MGRRNRSLPSSSSRRQLLMKERAVSTARNISESKFAGALVEGKARECRLLSGQLGKLELEVRKKFNHFDQEKKNFLQSLHFPEPTLIVERPPSPEAVKSQMTYQAGDARELYNIDTREPGYLKPTRAWIKTPSTLPTIDAFVVKTKKKVNIWEAPMLEHAKPEFKCTVPPTYPLNRREKSELKRGWDHHRPRTTELLRTPDPSPAERGQRSNKLASTEVTRMDSAGQEDGGDNVFITRTNFSMYVPSSSEDAKRYDKKGKSVTFALSSADKRRQPVQSREKTVKMKENLAKFERIRESQMKALEGR